MGRASSSKKVARASRAANRPGSSRSWGWTIALTSVVLLGLLLVVVSRGGEADAEPPLLNDHWHAAYGISICGDFLPPLSDAVADRSGIHSHGDGLMHIHPFSTRYTGEGANIDAFFETVGAEISDDSITLPDGRTFTNGDECGGERSVLRLEAWDGLRDEEGRVLEEDFGDFAPDDGTVFTIAFGPQGAEIPKPPSAGTPPADVPGGQPPVTDVVPEEGDTGGDAGEPTEGTDTTGATDTTEATDSTEATDTTEATDGTAGEASTTTTP